jgi:methyl-accepting chemotaxis protein
MKALFAAYSDSAYEIRLKAPVAAILEAGVALLLLPLSAIQFFTGFPLQGAVILGLSLIFFLTLIILLRGRYDFSVRMFGLSAAVVVVANQFFLQGYNNALAFPQYALLQLTILMLIAFLIRQKRIFLLYIILALLSFWGYVLFVVISGQAQSVDFPLLSQLDIAGFTHSIGLIVLYQIKRVFNLVSDDAQEQYAASESSRGEINGIMKKAARQLEGTVGLQSEAESTEGATDHIKQQVEAILSVVQRLNDIFHIMIEALGKVDASMSMLSERAQEQSANVTQSSAAIEEMVASIQNVAHIIESRRSSVAALKSTSERGAEIIRKTEQSFNEVVQQIAGIRDITSMISGIAAQTNLLAMNAAIEAAHAGDAGRGFAVVADEIRKLAENSSTNAKSIADNLKELITSIETTGSQVNETGASFSEIQSEVGEVANAMDEISSSTQELNSGSSEILKATTNLSGLTSNVLDSVHDVTQDNDIISENIEKGNKVALELQSEAAEISAQVATIMQAVANILSMATILTSQSRELNQSIDTEETDPEESGGET